jgi:hypothetical protein
VFVYDFFFVATIPRNIYQKENEGQNNPKKQDYKKKMIVHVACGWMT